ncbi:MAG: CRISPR-associated endoribonuclease Cas6 [Syntrophomonadaceae bacterium]|nr:CRISPR-associated endoribonuclease Cas6 [Syntrophomonadaceae bacterium]
MRLEVTFDGNGRLTLPIHHNHILQAAVYNLFEEEILAEYVHKEGFMWGKRRFKFFCFSRLQGVNYVDNKGKTITFDMPVKLVITSPVGFIVRDLAQGLLRKGEVQFGTNRLYVVDIAARDQTVSKNEILVRMLSPLTVYSTVERGGRKFTYYYSPFEDRFAQLVEDNLIKKYQVLTGRSHPPPLGCRTYVEKITPKDFKVLIYKGTIIKGWMGIFKLVGDPELLTLALDAGLGAKNSQGLGCCEEVSG